MRIEIVIHNPHRSYVRYEESAKDINEAVYDILTLHNINEATAIDCACWCELATDGESYNEENFDVYIG